MIRIVLGALAILTVAAGAASAQSSSDVQKRQDCIRKAKAAGLMGRQGAGAILQKQRTEFMKKCMEET